MKYWKCKYVMNSIPYCLCFMIPAFVVYYSEGWLWQALCFFALFVYLWLCKRSVVFVSTVLACWVLFCICVSFSVHVWMRLFSSSLCESVCAWLTACGLRFVCITDVYQGGQLVHITCLRGIAAQRHPSPLRSQPMFKQLCCWFTSSHLLTPGPSGRVAVSSLLAHHHTEPC